MKSILVIPLCLLGLLVSSCSAKPVAENPIEVGSVKWLRDYPEALKSAQQTKKPLLILFQEVPG